MITTEGFRRQLPDTQNYNHSSALKYGLYPGRNVPAIFANQGRALGFPQDMPPLRARWVPESLEGNGGYLTWNDVSGNGFHATNIGTVPAFGTGLRGRRSIVGDSAGADRRLQIPKYLTNGMTQYGLFIVFKTGPTGTNLQSIMGGSSFGGGITNMFNVELTGAFPCEMHLRNEFGDNAAPSPVSIVSSGSPMVAGTWFYALFNWNGANIQAYLNGSTTGTNPASTSYQRIYHAAAMYILGTNYASDFFWRGELLEIALFQTGLSAGQITALHTYAQQGYGL